MSISEKLEQMRQDRGKLSALRKAWRKTGGDRCWAILAELGCDLEDPRDLAAFKTVGSAFAFNPKHEKGQSMGNALKAFNKGGEKHLLRLFRNPDQETLAGDILRISRALKSKGVGLDYDRLFAAVVSWENEKEQNKTKRGWAKDYYENEEAE
jgi:CRISPR type I-E-associated protein CasB/Cse2